MNSKNISIIGETKCISDFVNNGFTVCLPYGDNAPYDLIVDNGKKLYKVQVKTSNSYAKNNKNIMQFIIKKTYFGNNKWNNNRYNKEDFDILYLYNYKNKESYLFFINELISNDGLVKTQLNIRIINNINDKNNRTNINYNIDNLFDLKIKNI